ncbi:MAG TPA: adenine-specific methyltransferase EcoRI family protein [Candidatus Paceibacterota bacterium]|nr:adenine-specific methyltransferase EcoRI family protein [Candidatus Paceibacterota bacterium]
MPTKSLNANLHKANQAKNDEFYTQLIDIEKELKHYKEQFRGKVVYCNCDDPFESNFFKYFAANFNALGLKKLITTSYTKSPIAGGQLPLFEVKGLKPKGKEPFKIEINEVPDSNSDGAIDLSDVEWLLRHDVNVSTSLKDGGDFRSEECVELLTQADIVVTNPPFSLFREYVAQLVKYKKKFLIIGNKNSISYKEIFRLIKENRLWLGYSSPSEFFIPNGTLTKKVQGLTRWFTNLDIAKRHEEFVMYKKYSIKEYPRYVNYDAIEIPKVSEVPMDYEDEMGVPITFLDKYNPNQFEILGSSKTLGKPMSEIAQKGTYTQGGPRFYLKADNGNYQRLYDRLIIKNKKVKK